MKLYLQTVALVFLLTYMADMHITFRPFSISFTRPLLVIGIILIMCGCLCLKAQWYEEGLKRGAELKQEVIEEIKDENIKEQL